jgi:carbonic anhydrase/acetyltransferase-like protein (isoleucine patch superfamily)
VIIEDNCVLHAGLQEDWWSGLRTPLVVGNDVIIGHGAVVHGTRIGDHVMIGMNATILQNVEIADSCVIAAGAVVPETQRIPAGSFVAGVPARIKGELSKNQAGWTGEGIDKSQGLSFLVEYIRKLRDASISSNRT